MPYTLDDLARAANHPVAIQLAIAERIDGPATMEEAGHLAASGVDPQVLAVLVVETPIATTPWVLSAATPSWVRAPGSDARVVTTAGVVRGEVVGGDAEVAVLRRDGAYRVVDHEDISDVTLGLGGAYDRPRLAPRARVRDAGGVVGGTLVGLGGLVALSALATSTAASNCSSDVAYCSGIPQESTGVAFGGGLALLAAGGVTLGFTVPVGRPERLAWLDEDEP